MVVCVCVINYACVCCAYVMCMLCVCEDPTLPCSAASVDADDPVDDEVCDNTPSVR